jgi:hypothetical protein
LASLEENPKRRPLNDIEAARERVEDESGDEGGAQQIQFENGFTGKVMVGTIFVCLIMLPGAIYLGLVAGQSLGAAAQWVTIVLFSEIARRSFLPLKRQEIYCLYYMAGALAYTGFGAGGLPGISGGPFGNWIALQYLMQSPALAPIVHQLPHWIGPQPGSRAYTQRTFIDSAWTVPLIILLLGQLFDRMKWMGLGYLLFRLTSDVERLPFPFAPIAASGATALAEASSKEESWRWRVFSTGTIIGLVFGFFYLAIPIFTGVVFSKPVSLLPIPFIDLTPSTERALPTALVGYNPDLGALMFGFILPFPIVLGGFLSSVIAQIGLNPILYHIGQLHPNHGLNSIFPHWIPGSPTIQTQTALNFDFWLSFGIGTNIAIAVIGLAVIFRTLGRGKNQEQKARRGTFAPPPGRGDFPWPMALGAWFTASIGYVVLCHWLVPDFPFTWVIFFALVWTPLNSYISARMVGLTGQPVTFPYLNQGAVLASHYTRPDIWFAPLPLNDYGPQAQRFREIELTGTKFTSILKLELFMFPLILIASFVYWGFLWKTTDIPSPQFPFAQKLWPQSAVMFSIFTQINAPGGASWAKHAFHTNYMAMGGGFALIFYLLTLIFKWPLLFFYGFIGGIQNLPANAIPTFLGAMLGRLYFARRLGVERWQLYTPVLLAGFACGTGLIGMAAIALALIAKTVNYLPF